MRVTTAQKNASSRNKGSVIGSKPKKTAARTTSVTDSTPPSQERSQNEDITQVDNPPETQENATQDSELVVIVEDEEAELSM
jgi:hypothetical protein